MQTDKKHLVRAFLKSTNNNFIVYTECKQSFVFSKKERGKYIFCFIIFHSIDKELKSYSCGCILMVVYISTVYTSSKCEDEVDAFQFSKLLIVNKTGSVVNGYHNSG